jgi:hypothetical protein
MAALGMMMGWVFTNQVNENFALHGVRELPFSLVGTVLFTFPVILCGLMLGVAAGLGRRAFLRIGLWTAAGGILGHLVTLADRRVNGEILRRVTAFPVWEYELIYLLCLVAVFCIYGFFNGAGLGLAFGGWKACLKYALIGLVANGIGILVGYFFTSIISRTVLGWRFMMYTGLNQNISYLTWSVMGALEGGILGWFLGKEKWPITDPVVRVDTA